MKSMEYVIKPLGMRRVEKLSCCLTNLKELHESPEVFSVTMLERTVMKSKSLKQSVNDLLQSVTTYRLIVREGILVTLFVAPDEIDARSVILAVI